MDTRRITKRFLISLLTVITLTVSLTVSLFTVNMVSADDYKVPIGTKFRITKDLDAEIIGYAGKNYILKSKIEAPTHVDYNTPIDCSWGYDGTKWYSGANLFNANVLADGSVVMNGGQLQWNPRIIIGSDSLKLASMAYNYCLPVDPYNANYQRNVIQFAYEDKNGVQCYRHLRAIEGVLLEYFIFNKKPSGDIIIQQNMVGDKSHVARVSAWDSDYKPIPIYDNGDTKVVKLSDIQYVKYPITIDPTTPYYTSASDGENLYTDLDYATAWGAASAEIMYNTITATNVGQTLGGGIEGIYRSYYYFDTSDLPDSATITAGSLNLYGQNDNSATDFSLQIQSGMPTYPSDPLVKADYDQSFYAGNGGTLSTAGGYSTIGYNTITLSAAGLLMVNTTGDTKLCVRSDQDIIADTPLSDESVASWTYEKGAGFRPYLEVTYTVDAPTVTTSTPSSISCTWALFGGEITNTGGEDCNSRGFVYGTVSNTTTPADTEAEPASYTNNYTTWSTYGTGSWTANITGLTTGTTYYFRSFAENVNGGWGYSSQGSFTTDSAPTISTQPAVSVSATGARLVGYIDDDNGDTCEARFGYAAFTGNFSTYTTNTTWVDGYSTGDYPYVDISGLTASTTYYFMFTARNDCGEGVWGAERTFTTGTGVEAPNNLVLTPTTDSIGLSWAKGSGATDTVVRYGVNTCPTSNTTGTLLYSGTNTYYDHEGLTAGSTYCYTMWGLSGGIWSASNITAYATVMVSADSGDDLPTPTEPTFYSGDPELTTIQEELPISIFIDDAEDALGMPNNNLYVISALLLAFIAGAVAYWKTRHVEFGTLAMALVILVGWSTHIIPLWIFVLTSIIAVGVIVMKLRSAI